MAKEMSNLKNTNSHFEEHIRCLEKEEGFAYKGKPISETRNKQPVLKTFLTSDETAMWFSKAFLALSSLYLRLQKQKLGKTHKINLTPIQTNATIRRPAVYR